MFKRNHHLRIATVLQSLNATLLSDHHCLFGGGTAIVLAMGEYRESVGIDFLCSDLSGYRELRNMLKGKKDIKAIAPNGTIQTNTEVRADQYGIRTMLVTGETEIKFEIVFEGRIALQPARVADQICGVSTLTRLDMAASKLLANSDRWADASTFSRDIIDLAMLDSPPARLHQAIEKATTAYGDCIVQDLQKAIDHLRQNPKRLDHCMQALSIETIPQALLWQKIRALETTL